MAEKAIDDRIVRNQAWGWMLLWLSVISAVIIGGGIFYSTVYRTYSALGQCDEAIRATLKAPATYHRVDGHYAPLYGLPVYQITYDAENSYGVPLRSTGSCSLEGGSATWSEEGDTQPSAD